MKQKQSSEGLKGFALHILPLLCYCTFLFFISAMPKPPAPNFGFDWQDKVEHGGAFFLMALLAYRAARWLWPNKKRAVIIIIAVGFASLYGATDEIHQYFVPERTSDVFDWMADTVGAALGGAVIMIRRKA